MNRAAAGRHPIVVKRGRQHIGDTEEFFRTRRSIPMWEAGALAALALLAWLWFDSMRAREHAVAAGARPGRGPRPPIPPPTPGGGGGGPPRREDGRHAPPRGRPLCFFLQAAQRAAGPRAT